MITAKVCSLYIGMSNSLTFGSCDSNGFGPNSQGPQGSQGAQGISGTQGPQGTQEQLHPEVRLSKKKVFHLMLNVIMVMLISLLNRFH